MQTLIEQQRKFAALGQSKNIDFRKKQLYKLKHLIKSNEEMLCEAIYTDLKKSKFETYLTEFALLYQEIDHALKNMHKWSKIKKVKTGIVNFPAKSFIIPEPYGTTLIIGAWNYPYQLTLAPLIASIAAGNTSIIKPSELPVNASSALAKIINDNFDSSYLHVLEGGAEVTQALLRYHFDKIFFTGSESVGKIVAKAAAEHLTPITLELGGKSPCLVFADADIEMSAKRIVWGKFINAGQTCIAPDYLLVEASIYPLFLEALKKQIHKSFDDHSLQHSHYVKIINKKHLERLEKLIDPDKIYIGGKVIKEENYIEPTVLKDVHFSDAIMQEEIFGPLLPVIPFTDINEVLKEITNRPKPLSFYMFGKNAALQSRILLEVSFGGCCINDVIMHISNSHLPFGGVGASGMGHYHSQAGFNTFSHFKSVLHKPFWFELPLKYPPYTRLKYKLLRLLLG
jgi:aldehyde dehydrogenase (NAD+)